jgi:hypothetical protein
MNNPTERISTLTADDLEQVAGGQSVISGSSLTTAVVGGNVVTYGYTSRPAFYGYGYGLGTPYGLGYGLGYGMGYGLGYGRGFDYGLPGPWR